jgi:hypothetical protein
MKQMKMNKRKEQRVNTLLLIEATQSPVDNHVDNPVEILWISCG